MTLWVAGFVGGTAMALWMSWYMLSVKRPRRTPWEPVSATVISILLTLLGVL